MTGLRRAALLLPFVGIMACDVELQSNGDEREAGNSPAVRTAEVASIDFEQRLRVPGVVKPERRAVLSTRTSGTVESLAVAAGDTVASGQLLVEVESRDLQAMLEAARLRRDAAAAAADKAERDAQRLARLYDEDLIALSRLEDARLLHEQRQGELAAARAAVRARGVALDYARIRAPFDGIVSEVLTDWGAFVGPGTPLVVLEDRGNFEVDASVPQQIADRLIPGQAVTVRLPGTARRYAGSLRAVIPALEAGGAGSLIRVAVDGADGDESETAGLRPGQVADVILPAGEPPRTAWRVPAAAVFAAGQLHGVFVVAESARGLQARLRWVELASGDAAGDGHRIVLRGLGDGERVVVGDIIYRLGDGHPVRLAGGGRKTSAT